MARRQIFLAMGVMIVTLMVALMVVLIVALDVPDCHQSVTRRFACFLPALMGCKISIRDFLHARIGPSDFTEYAYLLLLQLDIGKLLENAGVSKGISVAGIQPYWFVCLRLPGAGNDDRGRVPLTFYWALNVRLWYITLSRYSSS